MNKVNGTACVALVAGLVSSALMAHGKDGHSESRVAATAPPAQAEVLKPRGPDEETTRNYFTDTTLITQEGKPVKFYTDVLKDNVVLISTIYTNCEDACPLITQKLTAVMDRLEGDVFGKKVFFVSISTDPDRDTPKALTEFAKQQKADEPGWVYLTGEKQNLRVVLSKLGAYNPNPEAHSTLLLAGNVGTRHWIKIKPTEPPMAIALKLEELAAER